MDRLSERGAGESHAGAGLPNARERAWGFASIGMDVRYAIRGFHRAPGFMTIAILTLSLAVGASTAVFSVVYAVLLRPMPFERASDLVLVGEYNQQTGQSYDDVSPANFLDWRIRSRSFAGLSAFRNAVFTTTLGEHPERLVGAMVNANFFAVLGVQPELGRLFQADDERPGASRVAIIGDGVWRGRFGGRPDAIGRTARLNGELHAIVGVLPPGIDYPDGSQVWIPGHWRVPDDPRRLREDPSGERDHNYLYALARLRRGTTREQAQADMNAVAASIRRDFPDSAANTGITVTSLRDDLTGDIRPTLRLLFAAVGLLLLVAVANVSGLLLARGTARQQEVAIRLALGATRGRIVAQLLVESVLLALAGGGGGVLAATWLVGPLVALMPGDVAMTANVRIDSTVLLFGLAVSTGAGLLFGLAPARQALRTGISEDLKQSGRGAGGAKMNRTRTVFVAAEVALSLVLLVGAGLTIRSLVRLQRVPSGFEPDHLVTLTLSLPTARYDPPQQAAFFDRAIRSLAAVPGVEAVGATNRLPLSPGNSTRGFDVDGRSLTPEANADYRAVSPGYFRALRIPLVRGREFTPADDHDRPPVAIVSEAMARLYWPADDPVGHTIELETDHPISIVGVVGDVRHASLARPPRPTFYMPYRQDPWANMTVALRSRVAPAGLAPAIRSAIWAIDEDQPVGALLTMDERLAGSLAKQRFATSLLSAFGTLAVVLAAVGLYGVLAFLVEQRRREIGVRMALGASTADVMAQVLGQGVKLAAIGTAAGLLLAMAASRLLAALLYGTSPTDPATLAGAVVFLLAVSAIASAVPALRASRVDPLVALRDE